MNKTPYKIILGILLSTLLAINVARVVEEWDKRKTFDQKQILLITENAYLRGYRNCQLELDIDSSWQVVSKEYLFDKK